MQDLQKLGNSIGCLRLEIVHSHWRLKAQTGGQFDSNTTRVLELHTAQTLDESTSFGYICHVQ